MRYNVIATGSRGNAIVVENKFLLDIGVPYSKIKPYLKDISLVFISHCHSDHLNKTTVKKIAYNYPNIKFLVGKELVRELTNYVEFENIITGELDRWYDIGLCKFKLNWIAHDVTNYCLHLEYKRMRLLYCTDTNDISHVSAKGYDCYLVESNYLTDDELDTKIAQAEEKNEFTYLKRVKETHLSREKAIEWLKENMGENSEYCFIHLHREENSDEKI